MSGGIDGLEYPFPTPEINHRVALINGIDWVRVAVPWALNDVNCWILDDAISGESGYSLIDTGISNDSTRGVWGSILGDATPMRVLATHYHPDHVGLAGWFGDRGSQLLGHANEIAVMHEIWNSSASDYVASFSNWYREHGLTDQHCAPLKVIGQGYQTTVAKLPAAYEWQQLEAGDEIVFGHLRFEVMIGRGHSSSMIMLFCPAQNLLIAADQVLPRISPNISLLPGAPDPNPLASFLSGFDQLLTLPNDTLVLPSHGSPFIGLHERIQVLIDHHHDRLDRLRKFCTRDIQAAEVLSTLFARELDPQQLTFALGEAIAHLRYLVSIGELTEQNLNGQTVFSPA